MGHLVGKAAYRSLEQRLNRFPQGAPPSESLYAILSILFSEEEAALVAQLPIAGFTAKKAAKIWGLPYGESLKILDGLAARCILLDMESAGEKHYILPPPMAGFIEFSMMRTREDLDQKLLAELYYQYLNVEEDFVKDLFTGTETKIVRTFVNESVLASDQMVTILDHEKASHIIDSATHIGVGMCYCRHKMEHVGKNCDAPMDICMTFNTSADALTRHGYARAIDASECHELLAQAYENNLVQCGENVRDGVNFICNCCGCCCEALLAAKRFGNLHPVATTNYLPKVNPTGCTGCGLCEKRCPVDVITMDRTSRPGKPVIDENLCLGCGVCVRSCPAHAMHLEKRAQKIITPMNSTHRAVLHAIDKGMLQELIFDNKAMFSHRAMAAILSNILKLSPVRKAMASEQMRSIYLEKLITRMKM